MTNEGFGPEAGVENDSRCDRSGDNCGIATTFEDGDISSGDDVVNINRDS